ncbi:MAG TPA: sigma-54-dependent Fis family transcriptional regulator [Caldithrix sp.]|nr:sigma-54-dependent Fis family transcriptional regulator [Caldithrix sp.]
MTRVIIIDDDQSILNYLRLFLLQTGKFEIKTLNDSKKAFDVIRKGNFDILLLDMYMPSVNGLDILRYIKEQNIDLVTIVLTGVEDIDLAIAAMKLGTFEYFLKPIDDTKLLNVLDTAVEKIAATDSSVLIWGESGTGKELIAKAIHRLSPRKDKKFITVNAGVFANEIFSSEFFGHTKGSFTGAVSDKKGLIEEADGGTLFLDEIGELSQPIQVKLLRVLQEGEFYRVGSTVKFTTDVRIIAATNKDLFEEIQNGRFRKDLFFRLNINSIFLPPLKDRINDIELLARHFLQMFNKKYDKNIEGISDSVLKDLKNYSYPGNVRELMNIINSAVIIESSGEIKKNSLPHYFLETMKTSNYVESDFALKSLKDVEMEHIKKILSLHDWNKTRAAKALGISRVSLISRIKKYNLQ